MRVAIQHCYTAMQNIEFAHLCIIHTLHREHASKCFIRTSSQTHPLTRWRHPLTAAAMRRAVPTLVGSRSPAAARALPAARRRVHRAAAAQTAASTPASNVAGRRRPTAPRRGAARPGASAPRALAVAAPTRPRPRPDLRIASRRASRAPSSCPCTQGARRREAGQPRR
eukprot:scaffold33187_cov111-Isochrysis_galbana.AAC.2